MAYQKNVIIAWHESENGMFLEAPYKKEFWEEFKLTIPREERVWNKKREQWWISDLYLDEVDNLLFYHFGRNGDGRY